MVKEILQQTNNNEKGIAQKAESSAKRKAAKDDETSKAESTTKKRKIPMVRKQKYYGQIHNYLLFQQCSDCFYFQILEFFGKNVETNATTTIQKRNGTTAQAITYWEWSTTVTGCSVQI